MATTSLRVAFLHLAPVPGDLAGNRRMIETAVTRAAQAGAAWILTPELVVCGYSFVDRIGTGWISPQPDEWMAQMGRLVTRLHMTLFLSHPEQDQRTKQLHNSLFVITPTGPLGGAHRKINSQRVR